MKRLGLAIACALVLHAGLFWIGSGWLAHTPQHLSVSRSVLVSLSYRQTPAAPTAAPDKPDTASRPIAPAPPQPRTAQPQKEPARQSRQIDVPADKQNSIHEAAQRSNVSQEAGISAVGSMREAVPLYKINPPPRYPAAARRRGAQGTVILNVHIDEQGRVADLWLFESSGHRSLDTAAIEAVTGWRFEPGMHGDRPVAMWVRIPVRFELQ
jgi:periplasmic protein TonB